MTEKEPKNENQSEETPEQAETSRQLKQIAEQESPIDAGYRRYNEKRRAKMTPEQIADEDKRMSEARATLRWAEMSRKRKSGTPAEKAEAEAYFIEEKEESVRKREARKNERAKKSPDQLTERERAEEMTDSTMEWFDMKDKLAEGTPEEKAEAKKYFEDVERRVAENAGMSPATKGKSSLKDEKQKSSDYESILEEREKKRQVKMTPEQIAQEDSLYEAGMQLLKSQPADRIDSMTTGHIAEVMDKNWPELTKREFVITAMREYQKLKLNAQETDRKIAESNAEIVRLREEGKQAAVESNKAWGEVEKIMGRFGIRFKHK